MKFACIGSCIGSDIIKAAKNNNWEIVSNNVSFSHMAISDNYCKSRLATSIANYINEEMPGEAFNVIKSKINFVMKDNFYLQILRSQPDYVLVDLVDFRIDEYVISSLDGEEQVAFGTNLLSKDYVQEMIERISMATSSQYNDDMDGIQNKYQIKVISASHLTEQELEKYIQKHINKLISCFGADKLIFYKPRLVCNYVDGDNILYVDHFWEQNGINRIIERVYKIAEKYISYIEAPKYLIGDNGCKSPFLFHFCQHYYDYMIDQVQHFIDCDVDQEIQAKERKKAEEQIYSLYNSIICKKILSRLEKRNLLNRKIVLLARNNQFGEILSHVYGLQLFRFIEFNGENDEEDLEKRIKEILYDDASNSEKPCFVIPELYNRKKNSKGIVGVLVNCGLLPNRDFFTHEYTTPFELEPFIGGFCDVYNNKIELQTKNRIILHGMACSINVGQRKGTQEIHAFNESIVNIGKSHNPLNLVIYAHEGSLAEIGNYNIASRVVTIRVHFATSVMIGNNNLFSWDIFVLGGSGHAIFEKIDGMWKLISDRKTNVVIGNHVWIGFGSKILPGAIINDGVIIAAGSTVNKEFPNNVTIAGVPAKIVRRNVTWSSNPMIREITQDEDLFVNWANETIE